MLKPVNVDMPNGTTHRISALDGVRGYAAVVVLVWHAILGCDWDGLTKIISTPIQAVPHNLIWSKFWMTVFNGESAVVIFFLLSGCVLTQSAAKETERFGVVRSFVAFSVRRVLRVFPAVIVCVVACSALLGVEKYFGLYLGVLDVRAVVGNTLLLGTQIVGSTWTLQVEMAAVPFILVGGWALARYGYIGPLLFLFFSLVAYKLPMLALNYKLLSMYLFYLGIGALIPTELGAYSGRIADRIGAPVLILGFIFVRMFLPAALIGLLLQASFGYLFLCLLVYVKPTKLTTFLNTPVSQFLGKVSFGFYLWNVFFLLLIWGVRPVYNPPIFKDYAIEFGLIIGAILVLPSLAIAAFSERYVERPFIDMGRAVSDRIFGRAPIASQTQVTSSVAKIA
ncbi:acyltransferase family protein [Mesorhizobium kowhaii]|uniref:Acyltransferase 3 domain-containing protein n=1 Tax=Mesorhizobium kowhaii TaxID=1300272 RepID=A0A2W7CJF0_9HYPH|nr:acyltransferase [Mesorhizobium kowhaii]PZV36653.1 hypothetical protein B5V02_20860 [Mesorhizobium kowhaii]